MWEKGAGDALNSRHVEQRIGKAAALPRCNVIICVTIFSRQQRERKSENGFECSLCPSNSWSRARARAIIDVCIRPSAYIYNITTITAILYSCRAISS